jgi:hypothetical protein
MKVLSFALLLISAAVFVRFRFWPSSDGLRSMLAAMATFLGNVVLCAAVAATDSAPILGAQLLALAAGAATIMWLERKPPRPHGTR